MECLIPRKDDWILIQKRLIKNRDDVHYLLKGKLAFFKKWKTYQIKENSSWLIPFPLFNRDFGIWEKIEFPGGTIRPKRIKMRSSYWLKIIQPCFLFQIFKNRNKSKWDFEKIEKGSFLLFPFKSLRGIFNLFLSFLGQTIYLLFLSFISYPIPRKTDWIHLSFWYKVYWKQ